MDGNARADGPAALGQILLRGAGIVPYLHRVWGENVATFAAIRDRFDPDGMFLNPALERILHHHDEPVHTE